MKELKVKLVKLKNESEEVLVLVNATMMSLTKLLETNPMALYELVEVCRKPDHQIFGELDKVLRDFSLLQCDNKPHSSIKNIVLSAIEGEGLDMCVVNPVK